MVIRKSFSAFEIKAASDEPGVIECIASVTGNEDLGGDIVVPGAFKGYLDSVKSGGSHLPSLCWGHRSDDLYHLTGRVVGLEELMPGDGRLPEKLLRAGYGGLFVKAAYNLNTSAGREAYEHVKARDVHEFSFMFQAPEIGYDAKGRRLLKTINPVYEVSNVMVGMNPETVQLSVKARTRVESAQRIIEDLKADWSTAYKNDLPDSAFAYIEAGGKKDDEGKTTPRSLRHFPHHDKGGEPDEAHVRNALARIPQSDVPDAAKSKALSHVKAHAKKLGIEVSDDAGKSGEETAETKDANGNLEVPALTGEEAQHNEALQSVLGAIKTAALGVAALIVEELNEDESEFGCVMTLTGSLYEIAYQGQRLIAWARGEASEDEGGYDSVPYYFGAPPAATTVSPAPAEAPEAKAEEPTSDTPLAESIVPDAAAELIQRGKRLSVTTLAARVRARSR